MQKEVYPPVVYSLLVHLTINTAKFVRWSQLHVISLSWTDPDDGIFRHPLDDQSSVSSKSQNTHSGSRKPDYKHNHLEYIVIIQHYRKYLRELNSWPISIPLFARNIQHSNVGLKRGSGVKEWTSPVLRPAFDDDHGIECLYIFNGCRTRLLKLTKVDF